MKKNNLDKAKSYAAEALETGEKIWSQEHRNIKIARSLISAIEERRKNPQS